VSERWGRGCIGTFDSGPKCAQSWNQIQTLKDCLFCHIYCANLGKPWHRTVTTSCTVSNRKSRCPRTHYGGDLDESLHEKFFCCIRQYLTGAYGLRTKLRESHSGLWDVDITKSPESQPENLTESCLYMGSRESCLYMGSGAQQHQSLLSCAQNFAKIHSVRPIFGVVYCCFPTNFAPETFKLDGLRSLLQSNHAFD